MKEVRLMAIMLRLPCFPALVLTLATFAVLPAGAGTCSHRLFGYQAQPGLVQVSPEKPAESFQEYRLSWSSPFVSPYPENNLVRASFFVPKGDRRFPAVIVLHGWREKKFDIEEELCRLLTRNNMAALFLVLPYHGPRTPKGSASGSLMVNSDPSQIIKAFRQSIMDIGSAIDWLQTQPQVISDKIGIIGISLGAIVANLAMGVEPRLKAGVSLVGGGDISYILWHSLLTMGIKSRMEDAGISYESLQEKLRCIDPLTYTNQNLPRHLLMVNGNQDPILPRRAAEEYWEAVGKPPIIWLPTGHYGPFLTQNRLFQLAADYLQSQFSNLPFLPEEHIFRAPTIKFVSLYDRKQGFRLGIFDELISFGENGRLSADIGLTTKGFFTGLSWHILEGLDAGYGLSLRRSPARLYLAAGLTF
jgi:fermentation-respiration switch protein FrsA (DUF1100 family)